MSTDSYLFVTCPDGGEAPGSGDPAAGSGAAAPDLGRLRGFAIADAQARFRRAHGERVVLAGAPPQWRGALERLGVSVDWDRALAATDPAHLEASRALFARLVEAGLAYRRGDGWYLRCAELNAESDRRLAELGGWSKAALATQRELLRRVDGFELTGQALDGTPLKLFTGHPDSIGSAAFVGLSPQLPEVDGWLGEADLRERVERMRGRDWSGTPAAELPVVDVGMSAQVPGVPQPLPILVSPAVDARFGPAAILGIPDADPADKAMAKGLPKLGGLAWKAESKGGPQAEPAVRFLATDMPLARAGGGGDVASPASGAPRPDAPTGEAGRTAQPAAAAPGPGAPAGEAVSIHPRFAAAWLELALAVPPDRRGEGPLDAPELADLLPTALTVAAPDAGGALLDGRTLAKALRDAGALPSLPDGEPHGPTILHGALRLEGTAPLDELIDTHGADAVRFALLHAAAPEKPFAAKGDSLVRQSAAFLAELRAFAAARLPAAATDASQPPATSDASQPLAAHEASQSPATSDASQPLATNGTGRATAAIDGGDGLRRRLARWCDTAVARMGENYERLDTHRATRNAIELLARIQDFERRVAEHRGEVTGPDRDASAIAVAILVDLVAPLAPNLADDLRAARTTPA